MTKTIFFFPNGNAAVCHGEAQVPALQKSWLELFAHYLESKGEDPTEYELNLPGGTRAEFFRTPDGYNWQIL